MANETYSGTSGSGANAGVWAAIVTIDGVDQSARIVGEIRVDAEEDSARIAELTIRPASATVFRISDWVGKSIAVDIADVSSGSAANIQRLFLGIIDTPSLAIEGNTIGLRCTDNLQGLLDSMSAAAIDAAITGGYASPVIFDPAARGWARSQDRLSTVPASLDLSPAGALRLTNWAPKSTPDFSFTSSHVLDGSLSVSLSGRSQLVNQVNVDFGYRFPRVRAEGYSLSYTYVTEGSISDYAAALNWFLQRASVEQAIKGSGASIESISYTALPNTSIGSWITGPYDKDLCMGFTAFVSFDYVQTIEEQHAIAVSAPNSISVVGTLSDRLSGALEGQYPPVAAAEHAMLLYKNDISGIPPQDTATPSAGYTTSANVTLTADTDRTSANAAMQSLVAVAKRRIWGSHRQNSASFAVPLNPAIDLPATIDLNVPRLHAKGKCRRVSHRLTPDSGQATSEVTMAICSVAGEGVSHPDTAISSPSASTPATTALASGATIDFNYGASEDHVITITFPAVDSVERNRAVVAINTAFSATLTEDVFSVSIE
jgi:hypothetical protein